MRPVTHKLFASVAVVWDGRLLIVQEGKTDVHGKWNLPGGHVEPGESLRAAAAREVREETGLDVEPAALLEIFTGPDWVRFVFRADAPNDRAAAGDEIIAVRRVDPGEMDAMLDDELEHVAMMRGVFTAVRKPTSGAPVLVEGLRRGRRET